MNPSVRICTCAVTPSRSKDWSTPKRVSAAEVRAKLRLVASASDAPVRVLRYLSPSRIVLAAAVLATLMTMVPLRPSSLSVQLAPENNELVMVMAVFGPSASTSPLITTFSLAPSSNPSTSTVSWVISSLPVSIGDKSALSNSATSTSPVP